MTSAEDIIARVSARMDQVDEHNKIMRQLGAEAYEEYLSKMQPKSKEGSSCLSIVLGALLIVPPAAVIFKELL